MRARLASSLVALSLAGSAAAKAEPCFSSVFVDLPLLVMPPTGTIDVPTNATPVVNAAGASVSLRVGDEVIPASTQTVPTFDGFGVSSFSRIIPVDPLPAGALVTVLLEGGEIGTFTTGDAVDLAAPAAPTLADPGPVTGGCAPAVEIEFSADADTRLVIARAGSAVSITGERVDGASLASPIVVASDTAGTVEVFVRAIDFAGNESEVVSRDAEFPDLATQDPPVAALPGLPACSHAAPPPSARAPFGLLALVAGATRLTTRPESRRRTRG